MLSFGERIGLLRRRQGMTQRTLGEEADIHPNTIARLERGKLTDLPGKAVARLAHTLGTTTDYLLGLSEEETPREDATAGAVPAPTAARPKPLRPRKAAAGA
jgi:transcriptional regulator with XRE-family HTH domain